MRNVTEDSHITRMGFILKVILASAVYGVYSGHRENGELRRELGSARARLGFEQLRLGNVKEARKAFAAALSADEENMLAQEGMKQVRAVSGEEDLEGDLGMEKEEEREKGKDKERESTQRKIEEAVEGVKKEYEREKVRVCRVIKEEAKDVRITENSPLHTIIRGKVVKTLAKFC